MTVSDEVVERIRVAVRDKFGAIVCRYGADPQFCNVENDFVSRPCVCQAIAHIALTAALSDQTGGWQDISTVPKHNGLYVDLWFPQREAGEYGRIPDCQWLANETVPGWYAANDENDSLYYIGDGATHWMYRPAAPPPSSPAGEGQ